MSMYDFVCYFLLALYLVAGIFFSFMMILLLQIMHEATSKHPEYKKMLKYFAYVCGAALFAFYKSLTAFPSDPVFFLEINGMYSLGFAIGITHALLVTSKTNPRPKWLIKCIDFPTA